MNIVQLHERVRFWIDTVGSARFESQDIDNAINAAMNDIVDEKYKASRAISKGDSFQRSQKIRDELSSIVKVADTTGGADITISNPVTGSQSLIPIASFPSTYRYLLSAALYDAVPAAHNCWPLTYDRLNIIGDNPFRRPRLLPKSKQYFIESSLGITFYHAFGVAATRAILYYLKNPTLFNFGIERDSSYTWTVSGTAVIVTSEAMVYATTSYVLGDEVTITTPNLTITSGTVIDTFTESDINIQLHELIARRAAINSLLTIKEFDKSKALVEYFN